jgi:hypothetical protein
MVQDRTSERSSTQRKLIAERYEYELSKQKDVEDGAE